MHFQRFALSVSTCNATVEMSISQMGIMYSFVQNITIKVFIDSEFPVTCYKNFTTLQ